MKQNLIPYNDVWASCIHNMVLTLLQYSGGNTSVVYKNDYYYAFSTNTTDDGGDVNRFIFEKEVIELSKFAHVKYLDMVYSDEKFIQKVKDYIKNDNCFVAINVDLFDWFPDGMCYHQFHWNHYTLLSDYIEDKDMFVVFDEAKGVYESAEISSQKIFECMLRDEKDCILFIEIKKQNYFPKFTLHEVVDNAKKLVLNLEKHKGVTFYEMSEYCYGTKCFRDLDEMYFMKIKERQRTNAILMGMLNEILFEHSLCECENGFRQLEKQWNIIRLLFMKMYLREDMRKENRRKLNELLHSSFDLEQSLWEKVVQIIEPISDNKREKKLFQKILLNMK